MRLNVYIAKSGVASRRGADELIKAGKVRVDGVVIFEPFFQVRSDSRITLGDANVFLKEYVYLILHKPKGVTTTKKDRYAQKTIIDCLPSKYHNVFPVGRLDRDSTGLLILTNDGDFCHQLTHPKFEVEKEYLLTVSTKISKIDCQRALKGVRHQGELLAVKKISVLEVLNNKSKIRVVVSEGKKRHLRRLFKVLGCSVKDLKRIRVVQLKLGSMAAGEYRILSKDAIYKLCLGER